MGVMWGFVCLNAPDGAGCSLTEHMLNVFHPDYFVSQCT